MTVDRELESFRASVAHLDAERERRIREKFELGRAGARGRATPIVTHATAADDVVELVPVGEPTGPEATAARRTRRPLFVGVAAAVALLAILGGLAVLRTSDSTTDVGSPTEGIAGDNPLADVAERALARPDVELIGDQVLYQERTTAGLVGATDTTAAGVLIDATQTWERRDGTGREIRTPSFAARGPGDPIGPGAPSDRVISQPQAFHEVRDYEEIRSLPTDPAALVALVQTEFVGSDDPLRAAEFLARLLSLDVTPPAVRAAAFQALGDLGAVSIGAVATPSGVTGAAYQGAGTDGRPWVIVIDPDSTQVLAFAGEAGAGEALFSDAVQWQEYGPQRVEDAIPS